MTLPTRPELFFKATPHRVSGPGQPLRIRVDATWNVPEPELTLVVSPRLKLVGFTIGNDMSSRDIEGETPLYLPQAKCFKLCAALGPAILIQTEPPAPTTRIHLQIDRAGAAAFEGETTLSQLKRTPAELAEVAATPDADLPAAFARLWAVKEAFVKACGAGLALPLAHVGVQQPAAGAPTLVDPATGRPLRDWRLHPLVAPQGYAAALCTEAATRDAPTVTWAEPATD